MKPEATILVITAVIAACGAQPPLTEVAHSSSPEMEEAPSNTVAQPSPGPTPTRIPIGVIEEDRACLFPGVKKPPPDITPPEIIEMPELDWDPEPDSTYHLGSMAAYQFIVGIDGSAKDIGQIRSSGRPDFGSACRESIRQAVFKPARQKGTPIEAVFAITCRLHPIG